MLRVEKKAGRSNSKQKRNPKKNAINERGGSGGVDVDYRKPNMSLQDDPEVKKMMTDLDFHTEAAKKNCEGVEGRRPYIREFAALFALRFILEIFSDLENIIDEAIFWGVNDVHSIIPSIQLPSTNIFDIFSKSGKSVDAKQYIITILNTAVKYLDKQAPQHITDWFLRQICIVVGYAALRISLNNESLIDDLTSLVFQIMTILDLSGDKDFRERCVQTIYILKTSPVSDKDKTLNRWDPDTDVNEAIMKATTEETDAHQMKLKLRLAFAFTKPRSRLNITFDDYLSIFNILPKFKSQDNKIGERDLREFKLGMEYLLGDKISESEKSKCGDWLRQTPQAKDVNRLIQIGFEEYQKELYPTLPHPLVVTNYVKKIILAPIPAEVTVIDHSLETADKKYLGPRPVPVHRPVLEDRMPVVPPEVQQVVCKLLSYEASIDRYHSTEAGREAIVCLLSLCPVRWEMILEMLKLAELILTTPPASGATIEPFFLAKVFPFGGFAQVQGDALTMWHSALGFFIGRPEYLTTESSDIQKDRLQSVLTNYHKFTTLRPDRRRSRSRDSSISDGTRAPRDRRSPSPLRDTIQRLTTKAQSMFIQRSRSVPVQDRTPRM